VNSETHPNKSAADVPQQQEGNLTCGTLGPAMIGLSTPPIIVGWAITDLPSKSLSYQWPRFHWSGPCVAGVVGLRAKSAFRRANARDRGTALLHAVTGPHSSTPIISVSRTFRQGSKILALQRLLAWALFSRSNRFSKHCDVVHCPATGTSLILKDGLSLRTNLFSCVFHKRLFPKELWRRIGRDCQTPICVWQSLLAIFEICSETKRIWKLQF
jgi:hypothetical protein